MFTGYRTLLAIVISLWLFPVGGLSQIPNAGFETWSAGDPSGWATSNGPPDLINVTESTVAHGGTRAVRGDVVSLQGFAIQPVLQSGPGGEGFPYTQRPANFVGYYQFFPQGGDRFGVNVVLFKNGSAVAVAAAALSPQVSTYTLFSAPFQYLSGNTPDTCIVQFQIIGPGTGNTWHVGSYCLIDDIAFAGTADVGERDRLPATTRLLQNFPNPFNPTTTISYELSAASVVTLRIFDVLGRDVAVLVNEKEEPGNHAISWDARNQPSGVYYCKLTEGSFSETRKLVLAK